MHDDQTFATPDPAPAEDEEQAPPLSDPDPDPAPAEDDTTDEQTPDPDPAPAEESSRAPRSDLEGDLFKVLNGIVSGETPLPDGKTATPHTLAKEIDALRDNGRSVSAGAVSAALDRWAEVGFVTLAESPKRFEDYTDAGRTDGLSALKEAHRAARKAARAAEKEASNPAPVAVAATGDDAPF